MNAIRLDFLRTRLRWSFAHVDCWGEKGEWGWRVCRGYCGSVVLRCYLQPTSDRGVCDMYPKSAAKATANGHGLSENAGWSLAGGWARLGGIKWLVFAMIQTKEGKDGKTHSKAPKIQRLVTPLTLQRKRRRNHLKKERIAKVHCFQTSRALPLLCSILVLLHRPPS